MNPGPEISRADWTLGGLARLERHFGAIVFLAGLTIRLVLIHAFPLIHGVDSVARLVNSDKILLAHQLPLLQMVIHLIARFTEDPLAVRYFMAMAGAVAGVGAYRLGTDLVGRPGGFAMGLLFATQPFVLLYSIVPYQEILLLAGLLFAFHYFLNERWLCASGWLALACFSRYEAWIACFVLAAAFVWRRGAGRRQILRGGLLFGWAPLSWMAFQYGFSPVGTSALALSFSADKLHRYLYLGYIGLTNTPAPAVLLALAGLWQVWLLKLWRVKGFLMPGVFTVLFLGAVLSVGHGVREQPERYTTSREAHIPIVAGVFLSGLGLVQLPRYRTAALGASVAAGVAMAVWFVHRDTSDPHLRLSYETARYLESHVGPSERAVVLAKPLPEEVLAGYLRAAKDRDGEAELRRAVTVLEAVDSAPLDSQRVIVHSRLGRRRLLSAATFIWPEEFRRFATKARQTPPARLDEIEWLAVWGDFEPSNDVERRLAERIGNATPVKILENGGAVVQIYRRE